MTETIADETLPPLFQSEARRDIRWEYIQRRTFDNSDVGEFDFDAWWRAMGFRDDMAADAASLLGVTDRHIRQLRHKDRTKRPTPSRAFIHQCLLHRRLRDVALIVGNLIENGVDHESIAIDLGELVLPSNKRGYLGHWW